MKMAVLVSGGVDSSVALRLLHESGERDLTAFYLKIWLEDELASLGSCPWEEDLSFARAVCDSIGVPLQVVSLQSEYHDRIVVHAIRDLQAGRTPSPDILCNAFIKYGAFFERVGEGWDRVATGHYARVEMRDGAHVLLRAPDPVKDQTYFLSRLRQDQLARAVFPIGHLRKTEVRDLARRFALPNRDRPDSQGICFLGKIKFPDFVKAHLGTQPGEITDVTTGRILGRHDGHWFYTIGQRQGLRLGGGPWYVVRKDLEANRILVAHADHLTEHARADFLIDDIHWIASPPATDALSVRIRHGPALEPCRLARRDGGRFEIHMHQPDPGVSPGQTAVLYDGEVCLGAGTIV